MLLLSGSLRGTFAHRVSSNAGRLLTWDRSGILEPLILPAHLDGLAPGECVMSMRVLAVLVSHLVLSLTAAAPAAEKPLEPLDIGSRLELFVDEHLIESMEEVELKLHSPRSAGTALRFGEPWEGLGSTYVTVFRDEDRFRMYYRGSADPVFAAASLLKPGETLTPKHLELTCYAESRDGITWTKPSLGLFEFDGFRDHNIVWMGGERGGSHCFTVFRDRNPQAPSQERYKALAVVHPRAGMKHMIGLASPDGIHWQRIQQEPLLIQEKMDSGLDLGFWDTERGQYVAYIRDRPGVRPVKAPIVRGLRSISLATSSDFRKWTELQFIDLGDAPLEHFYTGAITPYFRAPHIYLAFPKRFLPWRTALAEAPEPGVSDTVFLTSRDQIHWDRTFLEGFIRPGRDQRNWMNRSNMAAFGVVPTADDEISLYIVRHFKFPSVHLERLALRTDGFVSVHAGHGGGELVTRPLIFHGDNLVLNFATSAAGSIRLEIQDTQGNPLPGFALEESPLIWGDEIEHTVGWERTHAKATSDKPLARIAGKPIRLRFVMKDADLYSLRFR